MNLDVAPSAMTTNQSYLPLYVFVPFILLVGTVLPNFESTIRQCVPNCRDDVVRFMSRRRASEVLLALIGDVANRRQKLLEIYEECENFPQSSTVLDWKVQGIFLDGPLERGSFLTICSQHGVPKILKILSDAESKRVIEYHAKLQRGNPAPESIIQYELIHHHCDQNKLAMIMPFYSTTLESFPMLDTETANRLYVSMSAALDYLHSNEFAHMDIKPANIFISMQGDFVLGDLGSIKRFGGHTSSTPCYVPCDKRINNYTTKSSAEMDWWMLAMTLYDKAVTKDGVTWKELGFSFEPSSDFIKDALTQCEISRSFIHNLLERLGQK